MSLAERISIINRGFFCDDYPADKTAQILADGTHEVVNWATVRPALIELQTMPWCQLQSEWEYFLDERRNPIGRTLELTPDRVNMFHRMVNQLKQQIDEPMQALTSVHPAISDGDIIVTINSTDLDTIEAAIKHVREVTKIAAIDDAITVASLQPGSLDIVLTAGQATLTGIQLAIVLAKAMASSKVKEGAQFLLMLLKKRNPDEDINYEESLELAQGTAKEEFWDHSSQELEQTLTALGKQNLVNEAKGKIDKAAEEILNNAEKSSVNWRLPAAVVRNLPNGAAVDIYDSTILPDVLKALRAPSD